MAAPSSRRASRLSAYYTREPSATQQPPVPSPPTAPPELRGRQAALQHADSLSRSLPLDQLLSHATHAKSRSDALQQTARSSTRRHYAQLQAAISAAQSARLIAGHVLGDHVSDAPALTMLRRSTEACAGVNGRLEPTRKRVAELDGVRVVQLLRTAAEMLARQLPALLAELALCTDPETARDNMLTAAKRFDAVRPAVRHLAKSDSEFAMVLDDLCDAARRVNEALREEPVDALTTVETARVRMLLGEPMEMLREHFLAQAADKICAKRVNEAVLGEGACERATTFVHFAGVEIVPRFRETAREYREVFGVKDVVQWEPFVLWAAHVADEAFGVPVRQQLQADVLQKRDAVVKLRAALDDVVEKRASEHDQEEVNELLNTVVDEVRAGLVEEAERQRDGVLHAMVDGALCGGDVDGSRVVDAVKEVAVKGEWFAREWSVGGLLKRLGRYAVESALGSSDVRVGRASVFCERVGGCVAGEEDVGRELLAARDGLVSRLLRGLCERADDLICGRLESVGAARTGGGGADVEASGMVEELLELLREARRIGEECGIECLVRGEQHELLGDEEHLGRCVQRLFVHRVREVVLEEEGVREVQVDAWRVARVLGEECFEEVSAALAERCVDEVRLMSAEEAAALAVKAGGGAKR